MDQALREELLEMVERDRSTGERLARDGSLFAGYHPEMEAIHRQNAARLTAIIGQTGWPGTTRVGADGAEAAWLIVQHSIGNPPLQRMALAMIRTAAEQGEAPWWQVAMLEDRIRAFEGRLQRYGTQFDWDENGEMSPSPAVEDPERVDERRRLVGLRPLAEEIARRRKGVAQTTEQPPADPAARRAAMDEWARSVGWRE